MWVWGLKIYAHDSQEDCEILYKDFSVEGSRGPNGEGYKPMLVKWFKDKDIKVLDVSSGEEKAIVKTEDKDGKIVFYAMQMTDVNEG